MRDRRGSDTGEHAGQIRLRIDTMPLGAGDERGEDRGGLGGLVMHGEEPVFAAGGHPLEGTLRRVVVDVEVPDHLV